ncbi:hypothetical protein E1B28_013671 [Marasmius oreades]|uniref:Hydrophobin n=1 Tax=Marasmius oreades TaxID=181124 RepID=A0A9P7UN94_9AGAR|nr:uncharacterized protein E1B28_013671 [Marasmius oreades]KAG7087725.1 hypothetical protein E1B28_013671 [Marasmius oreades]
MLFNKVFAVSTLTTLAAATAIERRTGQPNEQCPGLQCCQQTGQATDTSIITGAGLLDPLGLNGLLTLLLGVPLGVIVGLNCSPITVIGGGNGACGSGGTSVVCNDNSHGGLVNIGCVPITI